MQIKNYNGVIDGRNFFHQPVKNNLTTYDNNGKIATGHGDNFTAGCLLDYNHFNNYYKMITIDLKTTTKHLMLIQKQYSISILLQI